MKETQSSVQIINGVFSQPLLQHGVCLNFLYLKVVLLLTT